jgi:hypothetical protein
LDAHAEQANLSSVARFNAMDSVKLPSIQQSGEEGCSDETGSEEDDDWDLENEDADVDELPSAMDLHRGAGKAVKAPNRGPGLQVSSKRVAKELRV